MSNSFTTRLLLLMLVIGASEIQQLEGEEGNDDGFMSFSINSFSKWLGQGKGRKLYHDGGNQSLIQGTCQDKACWNGINNCAASNQYTCHQCFNGPPAFCVHLHNCASCDTAKGAHNGRFCGRASNIGCLDQNGVIGGAQTNCWNALTQIGWTTNIVLMHNQYVTDPVVFGGWNKYMTNSVLDCHTHCYFTGGYTSDPAGCCGLANPYLQIDKVSGEISHWISRPFYYTNVGISCDNGFQRFSWSFNIQVACHETSTVITQITPLHAQNQTVAIRPPPSVVNPGHESNQFQSSEIVCYLQPTVPTITRDTQGNPVINGLKGNPVVLNGARWRAEVTDANRHLRGYYEFYLKAQARGGAFIYTEVQSLNVTCDNLSCDITETANIVVQVQEVGSTHGWYFQEFTQDTDCPIETYMVIETATTALHASFPQNGNVWPARQAQQASVLNIMNVVPFDTTIKTSYTFRIHAIALGGQPEITGTKTLTYQCYNNWIISPPADWNNQIFTNPGTVGQPLIWSFSPFESSHKYCAITHYYVDNDNIPATIGTHTKASKRPTCVIALGNLCRDVSIDNTALGSFSFWISVFGEGGTIATFEVKMQVGCGEELVTVNQTEFAYKLFFRSNTPHVFQFITDVFPFFSVNSTLCPIVSYNLWQDANATVPSDGNSTIANQNNVPLAYGTLLLDKPLYKKTFYIQAVTSGGKWAVIKYSFTVCGFETVSLSNQIVNDYFWRYKSPDQNEGIEWAVLDDYFRFNMSVNSEQACYDQTLSFWTDSLVSVPWVNPTPNKVDLELNLTDNTQRVHVYTDTKFKEQVLYMKRESNGWVKEVIKFSFEICGLEACTVDPKIGILQLNYTHQEGNFYAIRTDYADFKEWFLTDSRLCKATHFQVYEKSSGGAYIPYKSSDVIIHDDTMQLWVKTHVPFGPKTLYLAPYGHSNTCYLEMNVTVNKIESQFNLEKINKAPTLRYAIKDTYYNVTKDTFQESYPICLSQFVDDLDMWYRLLVSTTYFGKLEYTNATGVVNKTEKTQVLHYNEGSNCLEFRFQGFSNLQAKYIGTYVVNVTLEDVQGLWSSYLVKITFQEPPQIVETTPFSPTYPVTLQAYIESVDEYGDAVVRFNRKMFTEGIDLRDINSTIMDIYIEPWGFPYQSYWYEPYSILNYTRYNLTWQVKEYDGDQMLIDITFNHAHWISMKDSRDLLVVQINNTIENYSGRFGGRMLVNDGDAKDQHLLQGIHLHSVDKEYFSEKNATMFYRLGYQLPDDAATRNLIDFSVNKKTVLLVTIFIGLLLNVIGLGNSFIMISSMVQTLQLAVHLPMFEFIFPNNVMIYLEQMIPVMMFDVITDFEFYQDFFLPADRAGIFVNIKEQIQKLGYESHNPFFNLGAIGFMLLVFLIRVFIWAFILWPASKCSPEAKNHFKKWKLSLFPQEFLFVFIEGYLEILIASILVWFVPEESTENVTYIKVVSVFWLFVTVVFFPICVVFLLRKNIKKLDARHLQIRWAALYSNIRIKNKPQMFYKFFFIIRRLNYVLIVFLWMKAHPIFQVLMLEITNLMQLMYFAHFLPKYGKRLNAIEIMNEIQVCLCTMHLCIFSDFVPNLDEQYFMGWVFIILLSSAIFINLGFILFTMFLEFKLLWKKYWRLFLWWLKKKCAHRELPAILILPEEPTPPPSPPPEEEKKEEFKVASYQPQFVALKGGKLTKMIDAENNEIERIQLNNDNEILDDDNWKHQSKPVDIKRPEWNDIPQFTSKMANLKKTEDLNKELNQSRKINLLKSDQEYLPNDEHIKISDQQESSNESDSSQIHSSQRDQNSQKNNETADFKEDSGRSLHAAQESLRKSKDKLTDILKTGIAKVKNVNFIGFINEKLETSSSEDRDVTEFEINKQAIELDDFKDDIPDAFDDELDRSYSQHDEEKKPAKKQKEEKKPEIKENLWNEQKSEEDEEDLEYQLQSAIKQQYIHRQNDAKIKPLVQYKPPPNPKQRDYSKISMMMTPIQKADVQPEPGKIQWSNIRFNHFDSQKLSVVNPLATQAAKEDTPRFPKDQRSPKQNRNGTSFKSSAFALPNDSSLENPFKNERNDNELPPETVNNLKLISFGQILSKLDGAIKKQRKK